MQKTEETYMRRALELASLGRMTTGVNPMVGAVIVCHGRIIGEGYHVRPGEGHAEVRAFASVREEDEPLLGQSTMYVTLEPCAHQGRTPPCARLIIKKGVPHVVVGCQDPFAKVSGRGIAILREAGVRVDVGLLERECRWLNRRFITFHTLKRPYIILKWAMSEDGFIDQDFRPTHISTPQTQRLAHKLRAESDAILVGGTTWRRDRPQLNVRLWQGKDPLRVVLSQHLDTGENGIPERETGENTIFVPTVEAAMERLYALSCQQLVVEGGSLTLRSFIEKGLYDEIRRETGAVTLHRGTPAPRLPLDVELYSSQVLLGNRVDWFRRKGGIFE